MTNKTARRRQRPRPVDSLSVREWLARYTDREPPFPVELLDRPVNRVRRALLRPAVAWLRSIGAEG